jgi:hypothetical protein
MKLPATIPVLLVLILALSCFDQHTNNRIGSAFARQEVTNLPFSGGNFSSHALIDIEHGDDIISEMPVLICSPELILKHAISAFVPAPVLTGPSPCWQPPESLF